MVKQRKEMEPACYEHTVRLAAMVKGIQYKKCAPRAVRELKKFATKQMGTKDVRIDTTLNQRIWAKGIRFLPTRLRVRLHRKRNEAENAVEPFYTLITAVDCTNFKGLVPEQVKAE